MAQWVKNCTIEKIGELKFKYKYFLDLDAPTEKAHHVNVSYRLVQQGQYNPLYNWKEEQFNAVKNGWHEGTISYCTSCIPPSNWDDEECQTLQVVIKAFDSFQVKQGQCNLELNLNPYYCVVIQEPPQPEELDSKGECEEEGYFWYDQECHSEPKPITIEPQYPINIIDVDDLPTIPPQQVDYYPPITPPTTTKKSYWWLILLGAGVGLAGYYLYKRGKKNGKEQQLTS